MQFQGISDGSGAVILASEKAVRDLGLKPLARLVGYSVVGVEPTIMGIGPAPAIEKLLKTAGKTLSDIDLVEVMCHVTMAIMSSKNWFLRLVSTVFPNSPSESCF